MSAKFSLIPLTVALLFTSLPAFAQVDPRLWETNLRTSIYNDITRGATTPQQAQIRLNEVGQIQQEHQQFLNQNGAPLGNVLTPAQLSLIRSQLDEVNKEREMDTGAYRAHQPFTNYNHNYWAPQHVAEPYPVHPAYQHPYIQQPQQDAHGNWGYKHHWGEEH